MLCKIYANCVLLGPETKFDLTFVIERLLEVTLRNIFSSKMSEFISVIFHMFLLLALDCKYPVQHEFSSS